MKQVLGRLFRREDSARCQCRLTVTARGLRSLNSKEYKECLTGLVARNFEPNESFYDLLVGVTAGFLSESDPNSEDTNDFDQFVFENIEIIRAAIERVKVFSPEIGVAEGMWKNASLNRQ